MTEKWSSRPAGLVAMALTHVLTHTRIPMSRIKRNFKEPSWRSRSRPETFFKMAWPNVEYVSAASAKFILDTYKLYPRHECFTCYICKTALGRKVPEGKCVYIRQSTSAWDLTNMLHFLYSALFNQPSLTKHLFAI